MEQRLIDANALMADIESTIEQSGCVNHDGEIMDCIRYAPTIDPVKHAEWIKTDENKVKCGNCGEEDYDYLNDFIYCPSCGARMDGEKC